MQTLQKGLMALRKKLQVENVEENAEAAGAMLDLGKRTRLAEEHFQVMHGLSSHE